MDTKKSKRIPLGTPGYHRLTMEKRIIIWTLKKAGKSQSEMAGCGCGMLNVHPSAPGVELGPGTARPPEVVALREIDD